MIISSYILKLLARVLTQTFTCRFYTLRNITLNGIKFLMTKKRLYSDKLDDLAIEIWASVFSSNLPFCGDPSHHRQLEYIHSALVESLHHAPCISYSS